MLEYPLVLQNISDTGQNLIKGWSTRRYYRTDQIQDRTYSDTGLIRYMSTRRYYRTYSDSGVPVGTTELIHVFQILHVYYGTYTCLTELILVLRNLYWFYGTYTGISDLIRVLQNLYMYFSFYMYITELILVLRNLYFIQDLFFCEGTRRYDESEQFRIIVHTKSDQTYTDTDIILS